MRCPLCGEKRMLVEHHIHGREIPGKNCLWNRCYICPSCHDEVHAGKIILEGYLQTSDGKKLIFHKADEDPVANEGAKPPIYSE
jgi:DNA-directed RNA polymerase subunit RPC12/RpoP